jgi:hypothetical protein
VSEERRLGWGKSVEDKLQEAQCGAGGPGRQHRIMTPRMVTSRHRFNIPVVSTYNTVCPRARVLPYEVIEGEAWAWGRSWSYGGEDFMAWGRIG